MQELLTLAMEARRLGVLDLVLVVLVGWQELRLSALERRE